MTKKLILPKTDKNGIPYLSYSQYSTWIKSKRDYIRDYFLGDKENKDFLKPYGDFGHKVGEALENNDFDAFTKEETEFMKTIPRYDEFEREIKLQMDGFYMKGYIDTNSKETLYTRAIVLPTDKIVSTWIEKLADYKTGEIEKRKPEYESEKYIQTEIYAAALEQEFGVLPDTAEVILIERLGNAFKGEKLVLGDKYVTINKPINKERIDEVKQLLQQTAEEISEYYQAFLKIK